MKSFKETLKESVLPDNWLKDLMKDVKNGEGWCSIDYIQMSAEQELNKDVWNKDKEIADQVKKLGFGNLLRESKKSTIKESVSTTSKKEIAKKADMGFAGYINDLKNALQDIKNEDYEWARYRIEGVADALKKLAPSLKEWGSLNKAGKLTESKKVDEHSIDFESIAGGLQIGIGREGLRVQSYSGGTGYNKEWKGDEYKKLEAADDWDEIERIRQKIIRDLLPVCDRFDKELESVMKKYGFKK